MNIEWVSEGLEAEEGEGQLVSQDLGPGVCQAGEAGCAGKKTRGEGWDE